MKQSKDNSKVRTVLLFCLFSFIGEMQAHIIPKKLVFLIQDGDLEGFKRAYNKFAQPDTPNLITIKQKLLILAQKCKDELHKEQKLYDNKKINKNCLINGLAQSIFGLYGLGAVILAYYLQYKSVGSNQAKDQELQKNILSYQITKPAFLILSFIQIIGEMGKRLTDDSHPIIKGTSWWEITPFIPFGFPAIACGLVAYVSGVGILFGWNNIKDSLNYQSYLKRKIHNIEQIKSFLELD